jgi:glycerophosphoryl diester phosphodiesterase
MIIIGHRGAAGLELENSLASLRKAVQLGVNFVEFDVRVTKDRHLVLSHDASLRRVSSSAVPINHLTLAEVRRIKLNNGERVPTLAEALKAVGKTPAVVEAKDNGVAGELVAELDKYPDSNISVLTFKRQLAKELKAERPKLDIHLATFWRPASALKFARAYRLSGIAVHWFFMTAPIKWRSYRWKLDVTLYTINSNWLARWLNTLYPFARITTDHPEKLGPK